MTSAACSCAGRGRRRPDGDGPRRRSPRPPRGEPLDMPDLVRIMHWRGEVGKNMTVFERGPVRRRLRAHVPGRGHARHRPRPARLHLPARQRRPGRGGHPHARARGPRRRPRLPAARHLGADLRLGALARLAREPHRGAGHARPHRAHPGAPTASAAASARSTASSSPSPTRCRTASPSRSSRPRARSSTPATSSSTSPRSTAATPTSPARRARAAGDGGIRLLLSDSTNAERPGHRLGATVGASLREIVRPARAASS